MSLRKTWAIAVREFGSLFVSPIVYGFLAVFLFLTGFLTVNMLASGIAEFQLFLMVLMFLFMTPLLTMRLIASERSKGTIEMIFTSPVRSSEFVLGKYLAVLGVLGVGVIFTLEFPIFLAYVGDPDLNILATQYLGLVLACGSFLAIGLFCSAITASQVMAAVIGFCVLFFLWLVSILKGMLPGGYSSAVDAVDITSRIQNFQEGVLNLGDVVFFLSVIVLFLYASMLYLNTRNWQQ